MTNAASDEFDLGSHEGLPILAHKIIINKTGDGLSKAMPFDPFEIEVDSEHYIVVHVHHRKTRYDNQYSKDDEKLIGVNRVDILEASGARRMADEIIEETVRDMERKIRDEADRVKAEKSGQFRMPEGEGDVVEAEGRDATIHSITGDGISIDDPDEIVEAEVVDEAQEFHAEFLEPVTDEAIDAVLAAAAKDDEDR